MDNHILNVAHVVRARQLQAASLICLLVAFIKRRKVETTTEVDDLLVANEATLENHYNNDDDIQVLDSMTSSSTQESSNAKKYKSKKRKLEQKDEALNYSKLVNIIDNVADAILEGNKMLERVCHREYTGEEMYKELELMGLEPHEILKALNFLAADQAKARTLFSCPLHLRMSVLKVMMGACS